MYETEVRTMLVARDNTTFALELLVQHDDQPFDFTDHVVAMQWRRGDRLAVSASTEGTDPAITVDGNLVSVTVPVEVIAMVPIGRYDFDVIATGPDGYAWQLAVGQVELKKGVTHD